MKQPFESFQHMLSAMAGTYPDRTALVDNECEITYRRLETEVCSFAGSLVRMGLTEGERVGLFGGNSADWLIAFFGILAAGCECINLVYNMREELTAEVLQQLNAGFLLYGTAPSDSSDPIRIAELAGLPSDRMADYSGLLRQIRDRGEDDGLIALHPESEFIALTSGSFFTPKGVALTQYSQLYAARAFESIAGERTGRKVFIAHPLYHVLGLQGSIYYLSAGGTVCLSLSFGSEETAFWAEKPGGLDLVGMSRFYSDLNESPLFEKSIAPYVDQCIGAGGFFPQILLARLECRYDHAVFISMYGQTECAPISINCPSDSLQIRAHSGGYIPEGVDLRIVDDEGQPVKTGEIGEILVKSPGLMRGYRNQSSKSVTYRDGYLPAGDAGYMDAQGRLYILGRIGREIYREDMKIFPSEIEQALEFESNLKEIQVFGLNHPTYGKTAVVAVVPWDLSLFDEKETLRILRKKMPEEKAPSYLFAMESFPRLPNEKVDLNTLAARLRKRYLDRMIEDMAAQGIPILSMTMKASVHILPPLSDMIRGLSGKLGFSAGRVDSIVNGAREALKQSIWSNPGSLNELRMEIILFSDRMSISTIGLGNDYVQKNYKQIWNHFSEVLEQADDFYLEQEKDKAPYIRLDYLYENEAAVEDYLNLEVGELLT